MSSREEELRRQLAEAERRLEGEKKRAERAEANQAPTTFEPYLQLVQQRLVSTLSVERDPTKSATGSVTAADRKYYPLELCGWYDF